MSNQSFEDFVKAAEIFVRQVVKPMVNQTAQFAEDKIQSAVTEFTETFKQQVEDVHIEDAEASISELKAEIRDLKSVVDSQHEMILELKRLTASQQTLLDLHSKELTYDNLGSKIQEYIDQSVDFSAVVRSQVESQFRDEVGRLVQSYLDTEADLTDQIDHQLRTVDLDSIEGLDTFVESKIDDALGGQAGAGISVSASDLEQLVTDLVNAKLEKKLSNLFSKLLG